MNLRRRHRTTSEVNTHALNDIMFFLLLFFLIASTLVNPNAVKLLLPKAASEKQSATKNITISIDANQDFYFNKEKTTIENLPAMLEAELKAANVTDPVILLNADETVLWGNVVKVMSIGKKLNAKVIAATKPEK
ncbi:MAG: biopolymer transporter ExbD [Sphingobacteriales bacterium]|nr:MAG: biopolymer transporter ExbD [Sphingobacteriales bacterium]